MAEENSNIKEANELLKLANVLDPNSPSELEIQWYMAIKQIGGVQQALKAVNSCKPLLSKVLLVMKSVHDIVTVTDIRIVYVFVLSYTSYFHIVEVKYG